MMHASSDRGRACQRFMYLSVLLTGLAGVTASRFGRLQHSWLGWTISRWPVCGRDGCLKETAQEAISKIRRASQTG